jgi:hypothetical protein
MIFRKLYANAKSAYLLGLIKESREIFREKMISPRNFSRLSLIIKGVSFNSEIMKKKPPGAGGLR